jgi:hypothetical protein
MTSIPRRLREQARQGYVSDEVLTAAADYIEELEQEIERLRALKTPVSDGEQPWKP